MANYKLGMVGAIIAAIIIAAAFAAYASTVRPEIREITVTVTKTEAAREVTVTQTTTVTEERTVTLTRTVERPMAAELKKVEITTLAPPSTTSWVTFVIEELELDKRNGIDIEFVLQPSVRVLYTDFPAGKYKVSTGGMMTLANFRLKGVPIKIFLTYQLFGTVIVVNKERAPDVETVKDLEGRLVAAPLAAENTKAMQMYLKLLGVDLKKIKWQNFGHAAVATELRSPTGKAVAGIMWAQLPSVLELEDPQKFKALTSVPELEKVWAEKTGTKNHWLLGFAAWEEVIEKDPELIQKIYDTFRDAVNYMRDFPEDTIKLISAKTKIPENVLRHAWDNGRLKFLVKPVLAERDAVFKLYEIAEDMGFIERVPTEDLLYTGLVP